MSLHFSVPSPLVVAGNGISMGMDEKDSLRFGVAASALKHTIEGDINLSNLDEVELVLSGDLTGR